MLERILLADASVRFLNLHSRYFLGVVLFELAAFLLVLGKSLCNCVPRILNNHIIVESLVPYEILSL